MFLVTSLASLMTLLVTLKAYCILHWVLVGLLEVFVKTFISTDLEFRRFSENIKTARKRRKLSLSALAIKSSVSKTVLSRIESGDSSVGIGKVFNVLDALGILKGLSQVVSPEIDKEQSSSLYVGRRY